MHGSKNITQKGYCKNKYNGYKILREVLEVVNIKLP